MLHPPSAHRHARAPASGAFARRQRPYLDAKRCMALAPHTRCIPCARVSTTQHRAIGPGSGE
eukprot:15464734-Alexandrium_andersonii.AAC.1